MRSGSSRLLNVAIGTMLVMVALAVMPMASAENEYLDYDIDMNCIIDQNDSDIVQASYGCEGEPGWIREDVNNDGKVDVADISEVANHIGETYEVKEEPVTAEARYDVNGDCVVNDEDRQLVVDAYGLDGEPGWIPEDINSDGTVNLLDVGGINSMAEHNATVENCSCEEETEIIDETFETDPTENETQVENETVEEDTEIDTEEIIEEEKIEEPIEEQEVVEETFQVDDIEIVEEEPIEENNTETNVNDNESEDGSEEKEIKEKKEKNKKKGNRQKIIEMMQDMIKRNPALRKAWELALKDNSEDAIILSILGLFGMPLPFFFI